MTTFERKHSSKTATILTATVLVAQLTGCGAIGDMSAIKEASEYAVNCQPDKAIKTLEKAHQEGGLGGYMAMLEKVVVLRDAGRTSAAEAALEDYMALPEVDAGDRTETEESIQKSLKELRKLREEQTGKPTCPGN